MAHRTEYPTGKELCDALKGKWLPAQRRGKAACPAHADDNPSLDIEEKDGRTLVICRAGCTQVAVLDSLRAKGHWPERRTNGANGKGAGSRTIVDTYDYVDETGELRFQVVRFNTKDFLQRRPDGKGGWTWKAPLHWRHRYVPYRLPELLEGIAHCHPVFVLEGEKDVNNARAKLGLVATCNAGGAGKWKEEHAAYLKGADVVIIPDNDDAGRQHADRVATTLTGIAMRVRTLTLPGLLEKGDISNWIEAGGTVEQLFPLVEQAQECKAPSSNEAEQPPKNSKKRPVSDDDPPHWQVEPWPEAVSGAQLLDGICAILRRYMVLPKHAAEAMALWVLHAWTIDAWEISPLLIVVSPTKQCGKSTLLTILFWLTPRSELVSNATASPIFRLIEDARPAIPTFLLDEGDSYLKPDKEDLRGILNSGWMRAGARVIRTDGDGGKRQARRFSTWAAKVIATIKAVADTLMDRGVIITLRRKTKSEKVERFRMRDTAEFAGLRRRARRWADDNVKALSDADPAIPAALQNRPADNWRALIAVADAAGGDWASRAREAAEKLTGAKSDDDKGVMLLRDIRRVFQDGGEEWLGAETLVDRLKELPETPWAEWNRGEKPISSRGVANLLAEFQISSDDKHRPRRYWQADFKVAWESYLPSEAT